MARPAKFERDEVLDRAMEAFWDTGYSATSMAHLTNVTRLKPGSLYAAFSSKEALFLDALDRYGRQGEARIAGFLASAETPLTGIRDYLLKLAAVVADPEARSSCFLVNSVLELANRDKAVQSLINSHFDTIESHFRRALEAAQRQGELPGDKDPKALAAFLMSSIWGLRVLAGTGAPGDRVEMVVQQILSVLER